MKSHSGLAPDYRPTRKTSNSVVFSLEYCVNKKKTISSHPDNLFESKTINGLLNFLHIIVRNDEAKI